MQAFGFSIPLWAWCLITAVGVTGFVTLWWSDRFLRPVPGDSWLGRLQFWYGWKKGEWEERRERRKQKREFRKQKRRGGGA